MASITYFKGDVGDEVVILVPIDKQTEWAAVENIVKGGERQPDVADDDTGAVVVDETITTDEAPVEKEKQVDELEI